jgi:predicted regulator of Ras-like GTPase activity (Roadblock/LC7/MglB family)
VARAQDSLFALSDKDIDQIFADQLGVTEASEPITKGEWQAFTFDSSLSDVPDSGLARLAGTEPMFKPTEEPGRIEKIGKFLLDKGDIEKIRHIADAHPGELKMRKLTAEAAEELRRYLANVGKHPGVTGSLLVAHDGLILASTMSPDIDIRSFAARALGIHMGTLQLSRKLKRQIVHQIVLKGPGGYVIIAELGGALVVTTTGVIKSEDLMSVMRGVTQFGGAVPSGAGMPTTSPSLAELADRVEEKLDTLLGEQKTENPGRQEGLGKSKKKRNPKAEELLLRRNLGETNTGDLGTIDATGLLHSLALARKTGTLRVTRGTKSFGAAFTDGRLVKARLDGLKGYDAIIEFIVFWHQGRFGFHERGKDDSLDDACVLNKPLDRIIIEAARCQDQVARILAKLPKQAKLERIDGFAKKWDRLSAEELKKVNGDPIGAEEKARIELFVFSMKPSATLDEILESLAIYPRHWMIRTIYLLIELELLTAE